ncbi:MAG: quinone-dependent dihydroorotate dehydrogenase [Candidatus Competibacteraceae bacterium]|jgi:dihydroorotate dehydrogenase|nr:quinone-dependent dihydroorotate dehydrogenase [Candidatus Competibacteraceae bacterium]
MLYDLVRNLLFRLDPETAHDWTLTALRWGCRGLIARWLTAQVPAAPCTVMGIEFPNPVGLSAGLDKNADYLDALGALGFGFIEVGTVTPRSQPGNPSPRLFRLPQAQALINRMGFNNRGVDHLIEQLQRSRFRGVVGVNIGKNFDTPLKQALDDYRWCLRKVYPHAHYVAVNISSPNTPGLRELQQGEYLDPLLAGLKAEQAALTKRWGRYVPLAVKIAPDLDDAALSTLVRVLLRHNVDAIIATNTTASRQGVENLPNAGEQGGLSGRPLREPATQIVRRLHELVQNRLPIIAVGGILTGADVREKQAAGASLVQLYTGLIYRGPALIREAVSAWRT